MTIEAERAVVWLWCARLTWALLPVTAGTALGDALDAWSTSPARVAAVLLWMAWSIGLVALLAPRPWGLTALRIVAPAAVLVALLAASSSSVTGAASAVLACAVAAALALSAPIAQAAGNSAAYGDEVRFPLRIPLALFFGPVPLAVVLIAAGVSVGPLLLADQRYVSGVILTPVGFALAAVLVRSLHALSRRWLVLVPAGLVVVDPFTLADPVLMRREVIGSVARRIAGDPHTEPLDLRLGTAAGTVALSLRAPQSFPRRHGRHDVVLHDADALLVATVRPDELIRTAMQRHISVA